jgi:RNA-binding protein
MKPIVFVGKAGVTETVIRTTDEALEAHELIKVRFVDHKEEKRALVDELVTATHCECAGIIGHVAILFRYQHKKDKRQIDLPE